VAEGLASLRGQAEKLGLEVVAGAELIEYEPRNRRCATSGARVEIDRLIRRGRVDALLVDGPSAIFFGPADMYRALRGWACAGHKLRESRSRLCELMQWVKQVDEIQDQRDRARKELARLSEEVLALERQLGSGAVGEWTPGLIWFSIVPGDGGEVASGHPIWRRLLALNLLSQVERGWHGDATRAGFSRSGAHPGRPRKPLVGSA